MPISSRLARHPILILQLPIICLSVVSCTLQPKDNSVEIGNTQTDFISIHYTSISDAFRSYDTNFDGFLDRHEYTQFQTDPTIVRIRNSIPELQGTAPLMFEEIDENEDGLISLNEMTIIVQPYIQNKN